MHPLLATCPSRPRNTLQKGHSFFTENGKQRSWQTTHDSFFLFCFLLWFSLWSESLMKSQTMRVPVGFLAKLCSFLYFLPFFFLLLILGLVKGIIFIVCYVFELAYFLCESCCENLFFFLPSFNHLSISSGYYCDWQFSCYNWALDRPFYLDILLCCKVSSLLHLWIWSSFLSMQFLFEFLVTGSILFVILELRDLGWSWSLWCYCCCHCLWSFGQSLELLLVFWVELDMGSLLLFLLLLRLLKRMLGTNFITVLLWVFLYSLPVCLCLLLSILRICLVLDGLPCKL